MRTAPITAPKNIATTDATLLANLGLLPFAIESKLAVGLAELQRLLDPREAEYVSTMVSLYKDMESILETLPPDSPRPFLHKEHGNGYR